MGLSCILGSQVYLLLGQGWVPGSLPSHVSLRNLSHMTTKLGLEVTFRSVVTLKVSL